MSELPATPTGANASEDVNALIKIAFTELLTEMLDKPKKDWNRMKIIHAFVQLRHFLRIVQVTNADITDDVLTIIPPKLRRQFLEVFLLTIGKAVK